MAKTEYRNAVRSRRLIGDALLELLEEKPLEKITVTDIANRADVSRGTFYLHYESVSDVISELQDNYIQQMDRYFSTLDIPFTVDNAMLITAECLKYIYRQNQAKYLSLIFHQQVSFADKVCQNFQQRLLESKDMPTDEAARKEIIVRSSLMAHGILGAFHAASAGLLDLSAEQLMAGIDHFLADMQHLQAQKGPKGGKS